jgi:hypothetical protein
MNRKDARPVFDADQCVCVAGLEQKPTKRSGTVVARQTVRHDKTKASARTRERNGTLDKELIGVGVPIGLR